MAEIPQAQFERMLKALEALGAEKTGRRRGGGDGLNLESTDAATIAANLKKVDKEIERINKSYSSLYENIDKTYALEEKAIEKKILLLRQSGEATEEQIDKLKKQRRAINEQAEASKQLAQTLTTSLGLGLDQTSQKIVKISQDFKQVIAVTGGLGGALKSLGVAFKTLGLRLVMKPIEAFVSQTIGLIKAQDAAISSFRKATGATAEYNIGITQLERRNFAAGVSAADAGRSFQTLFSTFSAFTQLNKNQQAAVGDTTALLVELGVSAQTSAGLFDIGMRAMGMSVGQANDMVLELAGSAQSLGVPINKMASDFAAASGELVKYGPQAIEVFKGLATQAKNSGLEVNQLLKITKQFDQFDTAGKAVGRLNAILGGPYLNSIDMLNASEEERVDILKRSVDVAGVSFDALNRFEQQAIAAALGMDVDEANKLFRMSDEQYRLDAMKQEELQELARETQEIGQQLKSAFMALAVDLRPLIDTVVMPLIKGFATVAKWIGQGTNALGQFVKVGIFAAAIAALMAAPFTGGASLVALAAITGLGLGGMAAFGAKGGAGSPEITPRFADGGVVGTSTAIVGEHGPELVEMPVGSRVTTAPATKQLTDAITKLSAKLDSVGGGPIQLAVYIGREKIDEIVVNALNSPAGKRTLSPYAS